eukprot:7347134-Prymnesium_polylepis.1
MRTGGSCCRSGGCNHATRCNTVTFPFTPLFRALVCGGEIGNSMILPVRRQGDPWERGRRDRAQ